jgi:hypothetical protein
MLGIYMAFFGVLTICNGNGYRGIHGQHLT